MQRPKMEGFIIAIDGPVASGKGTIAPLLANRLKGFYLQTGSMYRAVALSCIKHAIDPTNKEAIIKHLTKIVIKFSDERILLNGEDVTDEIRQEEVAYASSTIATIPEVRAFLVKEQQQIALKELKKGKVVVAEGRDTATKVFPDAKLKIFLTANPQVRAKRRQEQITKLTGKKVTFDEVLSEILKRDEQDKNRAIDPLVSDPKAHGYVILDNSYQTERQTLEQIINLLKERGLYHD